MAFMLLFPAFRLSVVLFQEGESDGFSVTRKT
jgi:hypothetical protein